MKVTASLALIAAFAVGCGGTPAEPTPSPTAVVTPSPSLEPSPSASPTASPSPSPSPPPSPSPRPTVDAKADALALRAYANHVVEQLTLMLESSDEIIAHISAGDTVNTRRAVSRGLVLFEDELDWLRGNPPAACYADAFGHWRRVVTKYSDAYAALEFGLQPPITQRDVDRGVDLLIEATGMVDGLSKAVVESDC